MITIHVVLYILDMNTNTYLCEAIFLFKIEDMKG